MRSHVVSWLDGFLPHHISSLIAPSWFTCVGLAGLVTLILMLVLARRRGIDSGVIASVILWCYVAAVVRGHRGADGDRLRRAASSRPARSACAGPA